MEKKKPESEVLKKRREIAEQRAAEKAQFDADTAEIEKIESLVPADAVRDVAVFDEDIAANKEKIKALRDETKVLEDTRAETVAGIKEVLISKGIDETKIALAYPDVEIVKATKTRTKGGPTKEERVLDAIKGGMNTKKALEAPEAGFDGDVHGQTFTLTKKGLIKATAPGVYEVV